MRRPLRLFRGANALGSNCTGALCPCPKNDITPLTLKLDPDYEEAIYHLGLCYLDRNWNRKAIEPPRT